MGYWVGRRFWGRGFATEAGTALVDIARTLRLGAIDGSHFIDNPASARVLEKLGFEPVGIIAPRFSCARGEEVPARVMRLRLNEGVAERADEESLAA
jgi:RimJ/RimL family protein N-acetyltransferase